MMLHVFFLHFPLNYPRISKQQGNHVTSRSAYLHHDRHEGIDKNNDEHGYAPLMWYTHNL